MELTMNSRSFNFSDYSHESEKSNKNSDLIMKRLRVKHKHTFFKKWFEKEHDYCLPTKNGCKIVAEKNHNDFDDNSKLLESDLMTPSKSITNLEKINVNNELSSCSVYAIDVTTELLKDALLENKNSPLNNYEQSPSKSKNCTSSCLNLPDFNKNSTIRLDKEDTKLMDNRIDKSSISGESISTLFSPMDIDSDMVKLFPTLDFFTEHNLNEKLEDTESREINIKNIILSKNVEDNQNNDILPPCASFTESDLKSPQPTPIKSILSSENKCIDDIIQPKLSKSNNLCKLSFVDSKNIRSHQLTSDQYINIFNRYQGGSKEKYIEQLEDPRPMLLKDLLCGSKPKTIISPYTHRHLKPYIFRDPVTKPLWLQMLNELKEYFRIKKGLPECSKTETIDYSYVRAKHIKSVNILARQFFWPGIDLSDSLLYPDFSVIALYKHLIIGFGFMVPDISTNENYITFLFTRPYWNGCGIGKFMLYHLIQTCMTRDITLHVSPNNTAMILYQKFGFKIEEFVQNFYVNYIPAESEMSKHALFLRLRSSIKRNK